MMSTVIDFHSHILPGIDDGSASVEESIALLKLEAEQGIRHVIATPHFYAQEDSPDRFLRRRADAEARLREAMTGYQNLPQVSVGAEVYYFHGISNADALPELTIAGKRCILIEMPMPPWSRRMYAELENMASQRDLIPVIAHIDRYIGPFRTHGIPDRLRELPVVIQANASFFLYGATRAMALRMLKEDRIHLLGSDCHNLKSRQPNLGQALELIKKRIGSEMIERVNLWEQEILHDDDISVNSTVF